MLMPEAAPHFDDFFAGTEHQVGSTRKFFGMEAISVSHAVDNGTDHQFRFHPFASDLAHVVAAPHWRDFVHKTVSQQLSRGVGHVPSKL